MNRDEIQKLIGGYATGTLTEKERALLFEAALDDQEIFEQLSKEQELKELLELPGARDRLIAAVDGRGGEAKPARWWIWAGAAVVAATLVVGVVMLRKPPEAVQVAQVTVAEQPPVSDAPVAAPAGPVDGRERRADRAKPPAASETAPAAAPRPEPVATAPAQPLARDAEPPPVSKDEAEKKKAEESDRREAPQAAAPAPPPAPAATRPAPARQQVQLADQLAPEAQQAGQAKGGNAQNAPQEQAANQQGGQQKQGQQATGVVGGVLSARAGYAAAPLAKTAASRNAASYAIAGGLIRITPQVGGYLSVVATIGGRQVQVAARAMTAGMQQEFAIPTGAVSLRVVVTSRVELPEQLPGPTVSNAAAGTVQFSQVNSDVAVSLIMLR